MTFRMMLLSWDEAGPVNDFRAFYDLVFGEWATKKWSSSRRDYFWTFVLEVD